MDRPMKRSTHKKALFSQRSLFIVLLFLLPSGTYYQFHNMNSGPLAWTGRGEKRDCWPYIPLEQHPVFLNSEVTGSDGQKQMVGYTHMSMLEVMPSGKLMAAWQGAPVMEGTPEQRIWYTYSKDGRGRSWEKPRMIPDEHIKTAAWSPVLHYDSDVGCLWLFFAESSPKCLRQEVVRKSSGASIPKRYSVGGHIRAMTLREGEKEWDPPRTLYSMSSDDNIPKVVANKMVVLSGGSWILPFWRQKSWKVCEAKKEFNTAGVLRSDDHGVSWQAHGYIKLDYPTHWVIEGSVVEMRNGTIMMMMRSTDNFIFTSLSPDGGLSWGPPLKSSIPNPDSKISVLRLDNGDFAMAFNDHIRPFTGQAKGKAEETKERKALKVALSQDDGETWTDIAQIDAGLEMEGVLHHYPTLQQIGSKLLVSYSKTHVGSFKPDPAHLKQRDGIWIATVDLNSPEYGQSRLLFDPNACHSTLCILKKLNQTGVDGKEEDGAGAKTGSVGTRSPPAEDIQAGNEDDGKSEAED